MISFGKYKDRDALVVESDSLRATFLHRDGAKMTSLVDKLSKKELLLTKDGEKYKELSYNGSYVDSECSAFDDMFPTIDPYTPTSGAYKGITYPDHGETCRLDFDVREVGGKAVLSAEPKLFDVLYEKTVYPTGDGGIRIDYSIHNKKDEPFDFIWAGHVMLKGEDGMRLITPFSEDAPIETVFATEGYNPSELPRDTLLGFKAGRGAAYKFYYLDKMREGRFSVKYADGRELAFSFDEEKLPYLGVWINNGEFQNIYNIAPEPCTAPFDAPDKALLKGYSSKIGANEKFEFSIKISVK